MSGRASNLEVTMTEGGRLCYLFNASFTSPPETDSRLWWPGEFLAEWFLRLPHWITLPGISNGWHEERNLFLGNTVEFDNWRGHVFSSICICKQSRLALCHEQTLGWPGCAAAGLNPHVSSECLPCSQWLSSAATRLQPAGGKGQGGAGPHQAASTPELQTRWNVRLALIKRKKKKSTYVSSWVNENTAIVLKSVDKTNAIYLMFYLIVSGTLRGHHLAAHSKSTTV